MRERRLGAAVQESLERRGIDSILLECDSVQLGSALAQREQGAVVGRALDEDLRAIEPLVSSTWASSTSCHSATSRRSGR